MLKFGIKLLSEKGEITVMPTSGSCTKTDGNNKIVRNVTLDFLDDFR